MKKKRFVLKEKREAAISERECEMEESSDFWNRGDTNLLSDRLTEGPCLGEGTSLSKV